MKSIILTVIIGIAFPIIGFVTGIWPIALAGIFYWIYLWVEYRAYRKR